MAVMTIRFEQLLVKQENARRNCSQNYLMCHSRRSDTAEIDDAVVDLTKRSDDLIEETVLLREETCSSARKSG